MLKIVNWQTGINNYWWCMDYTYWTKKI